MMKSAIIRATVTLHRTHHRDKLQVWQVIVDLNPGRIQGDYSHRPRKIESLGGEDRKINGDVNVLDTRIIVSIPT